MSLLRRRPTGSDATPGALLRRHLGDAEAICLPPAWLEISREYTRLAAERSDRLDLQVACAPGAGAGSPGLFEHNRCRIRLEGSLLPVPPEDLDPARPADHEALAALHGVFTHELGHAVHSVTPPRDWPADVADTMAVLEEIRMEAQAVRRRPQDATWLRAAASHVLLDARSLLHLESAGLAQAAHAATLVEGRVTAGSLAEDDVRAFRARADALLPPELRTGLQEIWTETVGIADGDVASLAAAARRFQALVPPDRLPGEALASLAAAVDAAASAASLDAMVEVVTGHLDRELAAIAQACQSEGSGGAGRGCRVSATERPPTPAERVQRNRLAALLDAACWRDRAKGWVQTSAPPGRLRVRLALQGSAQRARGGMVTALPWRQARRHTVERPRPRLAVLVDTSGSMAAAMPSLSSALWILAGAVADVGGRAMGVAFGDAAQVVIPPGKTPDSVTDLQADGGTDFVGEAVALAERGLGLSDPGDGPRIVVIVSDGCWAAGAETARGVADLDRLRRIGVGVAQIGVGCVPVRQSCDVTTSLGDAGDLADVIGRACVAAAGKDSTRPF